MTLALRALARLRRAEANEARRVLAEALAADEIPRREADGLRRALEDARRTPGEFDRESLAAFVGQILRRRAALAAPARLASERTAAARADVARALRAGSVTRDVLSAVERAETDAAARRDQTDLEETVRAIPAGSAPHPPRR